MGLSASVKACWLAALLAAVSAQAAATVYKKLGDEVVLTPDSVPDDIKSITWREGSNLAMEWEKSDPKISSYRQFEVRGSLNTSTGQMTITGLTRDDSNVYTAVINDGRVGSIDLKVISAVAVPNVTVSCNDEKTSCLLTCDGSNAEAELVTYRWKSDKGIISSSTRQLEITNDSSSSKHFICELENPVSLNSSASIRNPLLRIPVPPDDESQAKVIKGVIVFLCLLLPLVLLVSIHRFKTGVWFYEKESLPWSPDFWRKENTSEDRADRRGSQMEAEQKLTNNGGSGRVEGQGGSEML